MDHRRSPEVPILEIDPPRDELPARLPGLDADRQAVQQGILGEPGAPEAKEAAARRDPCVATYCDGRGGAVGGRDLQLIATARGDDPVDVGPFRHRARFRGRRAADGGGDVRLRRILALRRKSDRGGRGNAGKKEKEAWISGCDAHWLFLRTRPSGRRTMTLSHRRPRGSAACRFARTPMTWRSVFGPTFLPDERTQHHRQFRRSFERITRRNAEAPWLTAAFPVSIITVS